MDEQDGKPPEQAFDQVTMTFLCPPGFKPAAFIITAMDANGQSFTNAPTTQPHLALRLGQLAMDYAAQVAILHMQTELKKKSPIIAAPSGSLPPWPGPAGQG